MADQARSRRVHEGWAHTRFSVIGQLLGAPPPKGGLASAIAALSQRTWRHPTTGAPTRFGFSTIERWYYRALKEKSDPVAVLRRKLRADAGQQPAMSSAVRHAIIAQVRRPQGLERTAAPRQSRSAGREPPRAQSAALLRYAAPLPQGRRLCQAPQQSRASHGRG